MSRTAQRNRAKTTSRIRGSRSPPKPKPGTIAGHCPVPVTARNIFDSLFELIEASPAHFENHLLFRLEFHKMILLQLRAEDQLKPSQADGLLSMVRHPGLLLCHLRKRKFFPPPGLQVPKYPNKTDIPRDLPSCGGRSTLSKPRDNATHRFPRYCSTAKPLPYARPGSTQKNSPFQPSILPLSHSGRSFPHRHEHPEGTRHRIRPRFA